MKKFILILAIFFTLTKLVVADVDTDIKKLFENIAIKLENINKIEDKKSKKSAIKAISEDIVDLKWMGNFILGKNKKLLERHNIDRFVSLYSDFLIENYLKILLVVNSNNYKILSIKEQKENIYMVDITIKYEGVDTKNSFRIIKRDDKYLITDIITEGVSFISTQRSDVNSKIDSVGFEKFMEEIEKKMGK